MDSVPSPIVRSSDLSRTVERRGGREQILTASQVNTSLLAFDEALQADVPTEVRSGEHAQPQLGCISYSTVEQPILQSSDKTFLSNTTINTDDEADAHIFNEFHKALLENPNENQVFELVGQFENILTGQSADVLKLMKFCPETTVFHRRAHLIYSLEDEIYTWRLIKSLFMDRLLGNEKEDSNLSLDESAHQSDKEIVEMFFHNDSNAREAQLVIGWLENNFWLKNGSFIRDVSSSTIQWEATAIALRLCNIQDQSYSLITELDPDAPIRQDKKLADADRSSEDECMRHVYQLIRGGQFEEACYYLEGHGQAWRAATLLGWRLFHDPNFHTTGERIEVKPVEGNQYQDVWKLVCCNMSNDERLSGYERAVYGILSGNFIAVLPVCKSWEDYLWVFTRAMLDRWIDKDIRLHTRAPRKLAEMPASYTSHEFTPESIFQEIRLRTNSDINGSMSVFCNDIQKHLILKDVNMVVEKCYSCLSQLEQSEPEDINLHLFRFIAHVVLFLRMIQADFDDNKFNDILEAYVRQLIKKKKIFLVAFYTAHLPYDTQIYLYANFLENITDKDERVMSIRLAEEVGLDVAVISRTVVENIRAMPLQSTRESTPAFEKDGALWEATVSEQDSKKINAIDWLIFDPGMCGEAMIQANALMRTFITRHKVAAAKAVFSKLPPNCIDITRTHWHVQMGMSKLPPQLVNAEKEYLCHQAYLLALSAYTEWFHHVRNKRPLKPDDLVENVPLAERISQEQRMKQWDLEIESWNASLDIHTTSTLARLNNVILFPHGWMVDRDAVMDDERNAELSKVRELCVPQVVTLLYTIFMELKQYGNCLNLCNIVIDRGLDSVFTHDALVKFLNNIRKACHECVAHGIDITGNIDLSDTLTVLPFSK